MNSVGPKKLKVRSLKVRHLLVAALLLAASVEVAVGPLEALGAGGEIETVKLIHVSLDGTDYDMERAEYLYFTGDYLAASVLCKRILGALKSIEPESDVLEARAETLKMNRIVVLKWLSDLRLNYRDTERQGFLSASLETLPELFQILEALYEKEDYSGILSLLEEVRGDVVLYLKSLALYKQGHLNDARKLLASIEKGQPLYPYARILLAQVHAQRHDLFKAEDLLREVLAMLKENELRNNVRLYLGYIFFEMEEYGEAKGQLISIGPSSRFYRKAVIARIWAMVKSDSYQEAIALIHNFKPLMPYVFERDTQELMLLEAYCHYKLGRHARAVEIVNETIDILKELEEGYVSIYTKKSLPTELLRDIANMRTEEALGSEIFMGRVMESMRLSSAIMNEPRLKHASNYFKAFNEMEGLYAKKFEEINILYSALKLRVDGNMSSLTDAKIRTETARPSIISIVNNVFVFNKKGIRYKRGTPATSGIIKRWEKELNRHLTDLERKVVLMVAQDGERGINYLDNTAYNQFLYWMAIDDTKERSMDIDQDDAPGYGQGVLEKMVMDVESLSLGKKTQHERELPELEQAITDRIKDDTLNLGILEEIKDLTWAQRVRAEEAEMEVLELIQRVVLRRAGMLRNEVRPVTKNALALLVEIGKARGKLPVSRIIEEPASETTEPVSETTDEMSKDETSKDEPLKESKDLQGERGE